MLPRSPLPSHRRLLHLCLCYYNAGRPARPVPLRRRCVEPPVPGLTPPRQAPAGLGLHHNDRSSSVRRRLSRASPTGRLSAPRTGRTSPTRLGSPPPAMARLAACRAGRPAVSLLCRALLNDPPGRLWCCRTTSSLALRAAVAASRLISATPPQCQTARTPRCFAPPCRGPPRAASLRRRALGHSCL